MDLKHTFTHISVMGALLLTPLATWAGESDSFQNTGSVDSASVPAAASDSFSVEDSSTTWRASIGQSDNFSNAPDDPGESESESESGGSTGGSGGETGGTVEEAGGGRGHGTTQSAPAPTLDPTPASDSDESEVEVREPALEFSPGIGPLQPTLSEPNAKPATGTSPQIPPSRERPQEEPSTAPGKPLVLEVLEAQTQLSPDETVSDRPTTNAATHAGATESVGNAWRPWESVPFAQPVAQHVQSSPTQALAEMTAAETAVFARLAYVYRAAAVYESIPAFAVSEASASLLALRPGKIAIHTLLPFFPVKRRRRRKIVDA